MGAVVNYSHLNDPMAIQQQLEQSKPALEIMFRAGSLRASDSVQELIEATAQGTAAALVKRGGNRHIPETRQGLHQMQAELGAPVGAALGAPDRVGSNHMSDADRGAVDPVGRKIVVVDDAKEGIPADTPGTNRGCGCVIS